MQDPSLYKLYFSASRFSYTEYEQCFKNFTVFCKHEATMIKDLKETALKLLRKCWENRNFKKTKQRAQRNIIG